MAQLLRSFEDYFSNVARNLRRTYLRPFVIVTANMSKGRAAPRGAQCRAHRGAQPPLGHLSGKGQRLWPRRLVCKRGGGALWVPPVRR